MVWNSIPMQLAKENRKFIYGMVREGARAKDFELAIQWLLDCGLIHKSHRIRKPGVPLISYMDMTAFKIYMLDVGLLGAMCNLDAITLLEGNAVFTGFKGALKLSDAIRSSMSNYREQEWMVNVPLYMLRTYLQ